MKTWIKFINKAYPPLLKAYQHGRSLAAVINNTGAIKPADLLAFIVLRNETVRLPYFLDYYRKLGVKHFLFIDNDSSDGFIDRVGAEPDCSVWHTRASYKASKYGVHWLNYLLRKYGTGHWCLTLDPDEFLVFPHSDSRSLTELTAYLEQEGKTSFFSIMLDMYGDGTVDDAVYREGQDPLDVCPWFD
ncbi:MAG: glycosyltransferase family 2 protein, partial [Methylovulum sp.]